MDKNKIVKKIGLTVLFAGLVLMFFGCDNILGFGGNLFSPPSWIIGTWEDSTDTISYTFTSDNITTTSSNTTVNFKEAYKEGDVTEDISDTLYEATIKIEGTTAVYRFEKTSSTTVDYSITGSGVTAGPIELIKQ